MGRRSFVGTVHGNIVQVGGGGGGGGGMVGLGFSSLSFHCKVGSCVGSSLLFLEVVLLVWSGDTLDVKDFGKTWAVGVRWTLSFFHRLVCRCDRMSPFIYICCRSVADVPQVVAPQYQHEGSRHLVLCPL